MERTAFEEIETIALSHLHRDHYNGLLIPLPNLRPDLTFVIGRMPLIEDDPALGSEFLVRLMSVAPLDPKLGPLDLDLLRRVRQWAPDLVPKPVSQGEDLYAAGEHWKVLWPPRVIKPNVRFRKSIKAAIDAYDLAAEEHEWLKRRLEQMRESETYEILLRELDDSRGHAATQLNEEHFDVSDSLEEDQSGAGSYSLGAEGTRLLKEADELLRKVANDMSLVLASNRGVLLTGDA